LNLRTPRAWPILSMDWSVSNYCLGKSFLKANRFLKTTFVRSWRLWKSCQPNWLLVIQWGPELPLRF
jgi:hypothetical protein